MATFLDTLLAKLETDGLGTQGVDLFINNIPARVEEATALMSDLMPIDPELPNYRKGRFQVVVRSRTHAAGYGRAQSVTAALTMENRALTGYKINYSRPQHEPFDFPRSEGNGLEFSVNFDVNYVITG